MSDPHQATSSSVSWLLESLLGDIDDVDLSCRDHQCYNSSTLEYLSSSSQLPENGAGSTWGEWDDVVDFGNHAGTQSEVTMRKKRKQADEEASPGDGSELQTRQRGKNWEKAEEDILVECRSRQMDWKAVSECLQEHGFTRNHKHCADKWYALRKHYLEVHQWMAEHPGVEYWDRTSCSDRIRSVPPSFCQKWYQIFDAAENREGRKSTKLQVPPNQRRKLESAGAVMDPQEGLQFPAGKLLRLCTGDAAATLKIESQEDAFAKRALERAMPDRVDSNRLQPDWNVIDELVTEIQNLRQALTWRFDAEEKERSSNLAIQEKKLELKRQRFDYERRRDEEKRQTVAQCLH